MTIFFWISYVSSASLAEIVHVPITNITGTSQEFSYIFRSYYKCRGKSRDKEKLPVWKTNVYHALNFSWKKIKFLKQLNRGLLKEHVCMLVLTSLGDTIASTDIFWKSSEVTMVTQLQRPVNYGQLTLTIMKFDKNILLSD